MTKRKTIRIETLKEMVNFRNRNSTCAAVVREGWNSLLADALMKAKCYKGFRYLNQEEVPIGELPGIQQDKELREVHIFPDLSRVEYY